MIRVLSLLLILTATGCGGLAPVRHLASPKPEATLHDIHVISAQSLGSSTGGLFGADRSRGLNYANLKVSVPPNHQVGQIEFPGAVSNASRYFQVTRITPLRGFSSLERTMPPSSETTVYIHGFNTSLYQGAYQLAQIKHDFEMREPSVLFAWPSAGDGRGYLYDRDSVLFARDDLVVSLQKLTKTRGRVLLIAHSMGAQLTLEALRQLALEGDRATIDRLSGVLLISPDIDRDVFRRQVQRIAPLPQPFVIFVSQTDQALRLSSLVTGRLPRIGSIMSAKDVDDLPITIVDFTSLGQDQGLNHQIPVTSPRAIDLLKAARLGNPGALDRLAPYFVDE